MEILTQFLLRASFGLALAMAALPSALVTADFYRVHLWVILGAMTLAGLIAWSNPEQFAFWPPVLAAIAAYVGSVVWLYERDRLGSACLLIVAGICLWGMTTGLHAGSDATTQAVTLKLLDQYTSGLLLGIVLAAMLLGHWYLNTPTMKIGPLQLLVALLFAAVAARTVVCGIGAWLAYSQDSTAMAGSAAFYALRWLAGLVGVAVTTFMTWETLKIPNTQSATGILYVGVILVFIGELVSQLLGAQVGYPV